MSFKLIKTDSGARLGELTTRRGIIETPVFMPVGTQATVKAMTPEELTGLGAQIILSNTYHLFLKPGHTVIRKLGGLHRFMRWDGPILTDSGGYQIFSLAKTRKITPEGAFFQSPIDGGASHWLTPELAIEIQEALDSDIMMVLDECLPYPASREETVASMEISLDWAGRSLQTRRNNALLFGIVQGGMIPELRREYIERLLELPRQPADDHNRPFDGYAIGGLSVGEPAEEMLAMTAVCAEKLPPALPRYLMGVGTPIDILEAIERGMDMFDCILPTRAARHGTIYTSRGVLHIRNAEFREDPRPLDEACSCYTCGRYSRAYLRHLTVAKEILSARLCTLHNLHFYLDLLRECRCAINDNRFLDFKNAFLNRFKSAN